MASVDREVATRIAELEEERLNLAFLLDGDIPDEYRLALERRLKSATDELARLARRE